MTLWRISNHATLEGGGGLRAPGRWHRRGCPVVYCAPNPATALLEVLVHAEIDLQDLPVGLRYLEIEAPDTIDVEPVAVAELGPGWESNVEGTRRLGDEWLRSGRSALLLVPCVIVPSTWNVLLNPRHSDAARIRIARIHRQPVDPRLRVL